MCPAVAYRDLLDDDMAWLLKQGTLLRQGFVSYHFHTASSTSPLPNLHFLVAGS